MDRTHAYLRFSLALFNGHSCGLSGVAERKGEALVYGAPADDPVDDGSPCRREVRRDGDQLAWNDKGSCKESCGARGSFLNGNLSWRSRRPIRYMAQLKASRQYHEALAA